MDSRFFYHSFPLRGKSDSSMIEKGFQLLTSIREIYGMEAYQYITHEISTYQPLTDTQGMQDNRIRVSEF